MKRSMLIRLAWAVGALAAPAAGAPAADLYPALTLSHPGVLALGPQDLAWEDDPSELADAPAWDLAAGWSDFVVQDGSGVSGQAQFLSVSKGLADEGAFGLRYAQAAHAGSPLAPGSSTGSAFGAGYGWAMGSGLGGGVSLWQASEQLPGAGARQDALVGVGLRWAPAGQLLSVNGLWSKEGLARAMTAGVGGPLGGGWSYAALAEADGDALRSAQALLGFGPWRVFQRYAYGRHSTWLGWILERRAWSLQALASYGVEDPLMCHLALSVHGFHGAYAFDSAGVQYDAGWRSWAAPPQPAAPEAPAAAPAIPDVDPALAPPSPSELKAVPVTGTAEGN